MIPVVKHPRAFLFNGDSASLGAVLRSSTIDSIVCDPPAGIDFMGKGWDSDKGGRDVWIKWLAETLQPAFDALKPGGHALVWALPRTSHWTTTALENLGFEIRDIVMHLFGTGFPKSRNVSIDIDARLGAVREVVGEREVSREIKYDGAGGNALVGGTGHGATMIPVTAAATPEAKQWEGWGTALKPAAEHWILCRKPLAETIAGNVLAHGTGAMNIGACRLPTDDARAQLNPDGRWPAHVVLDEAAGNIDRLGRYFYVAKGTRAEKDLGCEALPVKTGGEATGRADGSKGVDNPRAGAGRTGGARNHHPTVKSIALMRWLCRLITPPGGIVLDPFTGSGSTAVAALAEGFRFVGCEREAEYATIAKARIEHALKETP